MCPTCLVCVFSHIISRLIIPKAATTPLHLYAGDVEGLSCYFVLKVVSAPGCRGKRQEFESRNLTSRVGRVYCVILNKPSSEEKKGKFRPNILLRMSKLIFTQLKIMLVIHLKRNQKDKKARFEKLIDIFLLFI